MNTPLSTAQPTVPKVDDRQLVEQENSYLRSIEMPEFSMDNEQDISEAARRIRYDNQQFISVARHGNTRG